MHIASGVGNWATALLLLNPSSLVSAFPHSLINYCLSLPFETQVKIQEAKWNLFPTNKQETGDRERICTQEDPPTPRQNSETCLSWHNEVFCLCLEDKETNILNYKEKAKYLLQH